jgi:hypothetical protein
LRFDWMAVFQTQGVPSPPAVKLVSRRINKRPPHVGFQYKATDEKNRVFGCGFVRLGAEKEVPLHACRTRLCLVQAQIPHGCVVQSRTPHCFVASAEHPLRTTGQLAAKFHLYVPKDCDRFSIAGECGPNRVLPMTVYDPIGRVVVPKSRRDPRTWYQYSEVAVPAPLRGAVWAVQTRVNADLRLKLEGNLPPLLSLKPAWAEQIGRRIAQWDRSQQARPEDPGT